VLIPCFKESLAIIQRTVLAAKRADRPPGMRLKIYICDDGHDEKKFNWVQRLNDPEVSYVTGRDKSKRSLNGKSANLNFCLQRIYPDIEDPENSQAIKQIPVNELMCLFDADQTCSKGFFMTMLRYIDSGDDVGVALSPQLMYNVIPDCDIFNHQNVHFWEMMQPGMDALGFISLTGTNMIMRSAALRKAGWFPMNSVTEDWALGMRFKKLGYRCRYVNVCLTRSLLKSISSGALPCF
jgi:cellulose synthase/poly-beta-1,6-N-acetylglucosamine synthase-like glycosyltransferase